MIFEKHWTISDEPTPPIIVTDPSVFHLARLLYAAPFTFATHPRLTVLEGFTPALNSQDSEIADAHGASERRQVHEKLRPSLTVMVFEAP